MDDLLSGTNNVRDALQLHAELTALLERSGMNLRKWASNNDTVLQSISAAPNNDDAMVLTWDKTDQLKTLGLQWNPKTDTIQYHVALKECRRVSKRTILSQIAQIFDPLGLLGPIVVVAKLLLQKI